MTQLSGLRLTHSVSVQLLALFDLQFWQIKDDQSMFPFFGGEGIWMISATVSNFFYGANFKEEVTSVCNHH